MTYADLRAGDLLLNANRANVGGRQWLLVIDVRHKDQFEALDNRRRSAVLWLGQEGPLKVYDNLSTAPIDERDWKVIRK